MTDLHSCSTVLPIELCDTDDLGSNPSPNLHIETLIAKRVSRRRILSGSLALAAGGFLGGAWLPADAHPGEKHGEPHKPHGKGHGKPGHRHVNLGFKEVPPSSDDTFVVPDGYVTQILAPWGTPIFPHG